MNFLEEAIASGRGLVALLRGRRDAPQYFDLGPRGLAGSFLAYLIALTLNAYLPGVLGWNTQSAATGVAVSLVLFATQTAFAALALQQFGRFDGLVPYLVADNWSTFYVTIFWIVLALFGLDQAFPPAVYVLMLLVFVIEINIARLIVTLSFWQIAGFLVAQIVGVVVGVAIVGLFAPIPIGPPA